MDDDLEVRPGIVIPAHELQWRFSRAGGPGGQGVNTTDSRVQLTFDVARTASLAEPVRQRALRRLEWRLVDGCLTVTSSESRSQWQNRRMALRRMADILAAATAPAPRPRQATRPTRASQERRLREKRSRGQTKRLRGSTADE